MIKMGIIGLGGIAGAHLLAYKRLSNVQVVAAADTSRESARSYELIKDSNIKLYSDYADMIEKEELDAVDICAPSYLHKEISVYALERDLHVLCEKPMAITSDDADKMVKAAKKSQKAFMCAQIIRFSRPYEHLRKIVESGELGRPIQIFMSRLSKVPRWRSGSMNTDAGKNGGVMLDLSIHDVDYIYSVFGEPRAISGVYHKTSAENYNDYISANLLYDGFAVTLNGGFYEADIEFSSEFHAIFEAGDVRLDRFGNLYQCGKPIEARDAVYPNELKGLNIELTSCFIDEIRYFVECINAGKETPLGLPESTAGGIRLAERIAESCLALNNP